MDLEDAEQVRRAVRLATKAWLALGAHMQGHPDTPELVRAKSALTQIITTLQPLAERAFPGEEWPEFINEPDKPAA